MVTPQACSLCLLPMAQTQALQWVTGGEEFLKNDVRTFKDLDGLGCYGDIGWYCVSHILWAFGYDPPETVQANAGASRTAR